MSLTSTNEKKQVKPGKCRHRKCGNQIKRELIFRSARTVKASSTNEKDVPTRQRNKWKCLKRDTWACLTCQEKKANQRLIRRQQTRMSEPGKSKSRSSEFFSSMLTLCSLSSRRWDAQRKEYCRVSNQQTKKITTDKFPGIPGYAVTPRQKQK